MFYKYKLKDCQENNSYKQRSLCRVALKKNRWKITRKELDFKTMSNLVDVQMVDRVVVEDSDYEVVIKIPIVKTLEVKEPEATTTVKEEKRSILDTNESENMDITKLKKADLIDYIMSKKENFSESDLRNLKKKDLQDIAIEL